MTNGRYRWILGAMGGLAMMNAAAGCTAAKAPAASGAQNLGSARAQSEALQNERVFLEKQVERSPNSFQALAQLAAIYVKQARQSGDPALYDRAEELARKSLAILPAPNGPARLTLANVEQSRHHFTQAIALAESVLKESSNPVGADSLLVTCYLAIGDLPQASRVADHLIDAKPSLGTYSLRALVMAAMGRGPEAIDDFQSAFRVEDFGEASESAWVHSVYARYLMRHGKPKEAAEQLGTALKLLPGSHLAIDLQGELAFRKGEWANASELFERAFGESKQLAYLVHQARAKQRLGQNEIALGLLGQAESAIRQELTTGAVGHRIELARLLLDRAELDSAHRPTLNKEAAELAQTELASRHGAEIYLVYARAARESGRLPEAIEAIRNALRSGVTEAEIFQEASQIELLAKNPARASLYKRRALETDPDFSPERSL